MKTKLWIIQFLILILITIPELALANKMNKKNSIHNKMIITLELAAPSTIFSIPISKNTESLDSNNSFYFEGTKKCSSKDRPDLSTDKCLYFHTGFKAEPWVLVPIKIISQMNPQAMRENLDNLYRAKGISINQGEVKNFNWGSVYNWNTETKGSAHYIFLNFPEKKSGIRLGPIPDTLLNQINFDFNKAKF